MRRGSVYWINLEPSSPPALGKVRPGLVVSNTVQNERLESVVVVPLSTRAPWIVGVAVATIFVEGSRNDRAEIAPEEARNRSHAPSLESDPLVVHHGLDPRYLELKRVHRKVEGGHRLSAWSAVLENARSTQDRGRVTAALETALRLWLAYRDGVAKAAKL